MTCTKEENLTYDANIHNNEYKYTLHVNVAAFKVHIVV